MTRSKFTLFILAVFALASIAVAQKTPNSTTGAPLKGVDVKLGKNPGGSPASRTTDGNGQINWGAQEAGSYFVEMVPPSRPNTAGADDAKYYVVEITGANIVGGKKRMAWEIAKQQFVSPIDKTARTAAPVYSLQLQFEVGSGTPAPVLTTIVKSRSNITNN